MSYSVIKGFTGSKFLKPFIDSTLEDSQEEHLHQLQTSLLTGNITLHRPPKVTNKNFFDKSNNKIEKNLKQ